MVTYKKKVTMRGDFAKRGVDIKDGDIVTIQDQGRTVQGNYGSQTIFKIKLADGRVKDFSVNQTSLNNLIDAFGEEAENWVGKEVKVWAILSNVKGKMIKVYYLSHKDAELDDNGEFVLPGVDLEGGIIEEEEMIEAGPDDPTDPGPTEEDFM